MMKSKAEILDEFSLFSVPTGGIGSWLTEQTHDDVFARLGTLDEEPLPAVQFNQLLVLGREAPVDDGFFRYYWLQAPPQHPYDVCELPGFSEDWLKSGGVIISLAHLKRGLYRLYVDALLYFGNVRTAFRRLRDIPIAEIEGFFTRQRFDTESIKRRGPSLPLKSITIAISFLKWRASPTAIHLEMVICGRHSFKHSRHTLLREIRRPRFATSREPTSHGLAGSSAGVHLLG